MMNCDWRQTGCNLTPSQGFLSDAFSLAAQGANAHPLITAGVLTLVTYGLLAKNNSRLGHSNGIVDKAAKALTIYGCLFVSSSITDMLAYQDWRRPETMGNAVRDNRTFGTYNAAILATVKYVGRVADSAIGGFNAGPARP